MEEFLYYGELFDIYGNLLNESNKKYYQLYYEENLTLQEIADLEQVSKSYIGNIIKKTSQKLKEYEDLLHIYKDKKLLSEALLTDDINKIKETIKKVLAWNRRKKVRKVLIKYKYHNNDFYNLAEKYISNYIEIDKWLKKNGDNILF